MSAKRKRKEQPENHKLNPDIKTVVVGSSLVMLLIAGLVVYNSQESSPSFPLEFTPGTSEKYKKLLTALFANSDVRRMGMEEMGNLIFDEQGNYPLRVSKMRAGKVISDDGKPSQIAVTEQRSLDPDGNISVRILSPKAIEKLLEAAGSIPSVMAEFRHSNPEKFYGGIQEFYSAHELGHALGQNVIPASKAVLDLIDVFYSQGMNINGKKLRPSYTEGWAVVFIDSNQEKFVLIGLEEAAADFLARNWIRSEESKFIASQMAAPSQTFLVEMTRFSEQDPDFFRKFQDAKNSGDIGNFISLIDVARESELRKAYGKHYSDSEYKGLAKKYTYELIKRTFDEGSKYTHFKTKNGRMNVRNERNRRVNNRELNDQTYGAINSQVKAYKN